MSGAMTWRFFQQTVWLTAVFLCLALGGAWAAPEKATVQSVDKRALILQLFEVRPPRAMVDAAIEAVAAGRYADADPAKAEFIARLQLAVDYDAIEAAMTREMTELYSGPELQAMVAYYTSELGQTAEAKAPRLREKIAPVLRKMLDQGLLDTMTTPSPAPRP